MAENTSKSPVITRFAPSPTGLLHAGNYRTAVFSYLFARQQGGQFHLRIEDTDKERSKKEYKDNILESLAWLGLEYDSIVEQSLQVENHKKLLRKLIDEEKAYVSKELAKDGSGREVEVVRFKNPNKKVAFTDMIRGRIEMDTTDLKDFVIARNINEPIFHFAVVVDDFTMGITHVVRGEDHISNTPRQILIQEALGAPQPIYAHLPLVLAPDRSKLSKRKGALAITEYRDRGFFADAMLNYMATLGWNPGTDEEIMSKARLIEIFDIAKVQKSAAIFDEEKLRWFNREYMKKIPREKIIETILVALKDKKPALVPDQSMVEKVVPVALERASTLGDIREAIDSGELLYFFEQPSYTATDLLWKDEKDPNKTIAHITKALEILDTIPENSFTQASVKYAVWSYATEVGRGNVLWPIRFALSGRAKSPDPFVLAEIFGKKETKRRLIAAHELLSAVRT